MKQVTMRKAELIDIVRKNRAEHREIFLSAQKVYRAKAIELLDDQLKRAREDQPFNLNVIMSLVAPADHTRDYDRAIAMLDHEVDQQVTLSEADFTQLVLDQWGWSHGWAVSNSTYVKSPKLSGILEQEV